MNTTLELNNEETMIIEPSLELNYSIAWHAMTCFEMYYLPALVVLGSLGNCLSVYVVFASKMRRTSSSFYLAALAVSDTGFLASVFVAWLGLANVHLMNQHGFCQFFVYLTNVCSFLSAWFVVAFTVERFVAVCYPLRRQWICTVNRAKLLVSGVTSAGLILCSPVLLYSSPRVIDNTNREMCNIAEGWDDFAEAMNIFDTVITFVLPFFLIVILNSLIVKAVWRVDTVRTSLKARASTRDSPPSVHQARVTKMLLIVSSVFFILNLPAYVMRLYAYLQTDGNATEFEVLLQRACNLLFDTNFGISFGLYCASGQNFRSAVAQLLGCRRRERGVDARSGIGKRSSTNQHGTDTIRITGTTSETIVIDKPWKDSFHLRTYPYRTSTQRDDDSSCYSTQTTTPKKDTYDARL